MEDIRFLVNNYKYEKERANYFKDKLKEAFNFLNDYEFIDTYELIIKDTYLLLKIRPMNNEITNNDLTTFFFEKLSNIGYYFFNINMYNAIEINYYKIEFPINQLN